MTAPEAEATVDRAWSILEEAVHDPKDEKRTTAVHTLGLLVKNPRGARRAEGALTDP